MTSEDRRPEMAWWKAELRWRGLRPTLVVFGIVPRFCCGRPAAIAPGRNGTAATDVTVIVGGVAGSDPVFGYKLLADKLLEPGPDLVTVNNSDVSDVIARGGKEPLPGRRQGPLCGAAKR